MYKFINKKMSLSGNSARYSPTDLKRISPKFKRLNLVDFRDDESLTLQQPKCLSDWDEAYFVLFSKSVKAKRSPRRVGAIKDLCPGGLVHGLNQVT